MRTFPLLLASGAVALLFGCASSAPPANPASAWDQASVTSIAQTLPEATEQLYNALYAQGPGVEMPGAFGAGDVGHEFKDNVRLLHSESMHLASELGKGAGRDATWPVVRRIREINDDIDEGAGRVFETSPVTSQLTQVEGILDQLNAYY